MNTKTFTRILSDSKPRKLVSRRWNQRSSVALVLDDDSIENAALLLIKRAEKEGDPWSGHMAFPGGRQDPIDRNGLATAKREMHEEVGFDADDTISGKAQLIGRLSDLRTTRRVISRPMVVSPYVFLVGQKPDLTLNHEVAETIWLPVSYFADFSNRDTLKIDFKGYKVNLPCYRYHDKEIWGLTLSIIDNLLRISGFDPPRTPFRGR